MFTPEMNARWSLSFALSVVPGVQLGLSGAGGRTMRSNAAKLPISGHAPSLPSASVIAWPGSAARPSGAAPRPTEWGRIAERLTGFGESLCEIVIAILGLLIAAMNAAMIISAFGWNLVS